MLKCLDCNNDEQFERTARVTEHWLTDNQGNCIEVIESYDFETNNDLSCAACGSENIERK